MPNKDFQNGVIVGATCNKPRDISSIGYKVTFKEGITDSGNSGFVERETMYCKKGESIYPPAGQPEGYYYYGGTREGYSFDRWITTEPLSHRGTYTEVIFPFTPTEDTILYAHY